MEGGEWLEPLRSLNTKDLFLALNIAIENWGKRGWSVYFTSECVLCVLPVNSSIISLAAFAKVISVDAQWQTKDLPLCGRLLCK